MLAAWELHFKALDHCFSGKDLWEGTSLEKEFANKASIEYYFENLRRVSSGQSWFFSQDDNDIDTSLAEYKKRLLQMEDYEQAERHNFFVLGELLCYDYSGYLKQRGMAETAFERLFGIDDVLTTRKLGGLRMPVARFIELHDKHHEQKGSDNNKKFDKRKRESEKKFTESLNPNRNYTSFSL
jgi:hypothetical protein